VLLEVTTQINIFVSGSALFGWIEIVGEGWEGSHVGGRNNGRKSVMKKW
jgi:hypothetical protein